MTLGAHRVPVLVQAGPVQDVAVRDRLVGVEMEPALATLLARPRVPGDAEGLHTAAREADQVLLQRVDAERVGDLVVPKRAVRTVRAHEEPPVAPEEPGGDPGVREGRVLEVGEHAGVVGDLHGEVVVRASPGLRLSRMALRTGRRSGVRRELARCVCGRRLVPAREEHADGDRDRENRGCTATGLRFDAAFAFVVFDSIV
jgi:hypothetical protein